MNKLSLIPRIAAGGLVATLVAVASVASAADGTAPDSSHVIYVPSRSTSVDHAAIVAALGDMGFTVDTMAYGGEARSDYARRVAGMIHSLLDAGVAPEQITVVGAGYGSPVAVLASAIAGNRNVNYVVLGGCDPQLKTDYTFRMSGRVLGVRDAGNLGSHSCRPLWRDAPKVRDRRDMVIATGFGASTFDQPREAWLQPLQAWSRRGRVDVGNVRIGRIDSPDQGHGAGH
jgi:hypothetical protein